MLQIFQKIINLLKGTSNRTNFGQPTHHPSPAYTDYAHLYTPDNTFNDAFYTNLIRTIHWTERIVNGIADKATVNYSTVLRVTNPDYEGKPFYCYEATWSGFAATPDISFNYLAVLQEAMAVREDTSAANIHFDQLGQILEFDIDLTTHDGPPCAESEGFVDESDIPPIDTWFYVTKTKLYCWIPNMFIEKMQAAIDVEIFDSYRWVKDAGPSLQIETMNRLKMMHSL